MMYGSAEERKRAQKLPTFFLTFFYMKQLIRNTQKMLGSKERMGEGVLGGVCLEGERSLSLLNVRSDIPHAPTLPLVYCTVRLFPFLFSFRVFF